MSKEVTTQGKVNRMLLGWLPIASICMVAWGNSATSPDRPGLATGEISFRVRDAYLFSLPLFLAHERENSAEGMATGNIEGDYQAIRRVLQCNAETYFRALNDLLTDDGIEGPKTGAFRALASVGIGAGQDFRFRDLPQETAHAVQAGYEQGQAMLLDEINRLHQDPLGTHLIYGLEARVIAHTSRVALR